MVRPVLLCLATLLVALPLPACGKSPLVEQLVWETDLDRGLARALESQRPALIFFGAEWDTAAHELEHETFADLEVRAILRRGFIPIRVDTTDEDTPGLRRLSERFRVVGDPTVIVERVEAHRPSGAWDEKEVLRFMEYVPPKKFAASLRAVEVHGHPETAGFW